jgi:hypothetical protein
VVLIEKSSKKATDDLEQEVNEDKVNDTKKEEGGNHGSAEEKKMYDPLVCNREFFFVTLTLS